MKKIICLMLVLAALTLTLCGCGFNFEKEDLSKYVKVADHSSVKYEEIVDLYNEYREKIAETNKNGYFKIQNGCTIDFKIEAAIVEETADSVSYTRYEPWSRVGDDYVKGYEYGRYEENLAFDTALAYDVENVTDSEGSARSVQLGKEYSFTLNVPETYEDENIAGKKVRFTVSMVKILPGISDDAIHDMLTDFYDACGEVKEIIEDGDWVVMSFKGRIDGKLFKGGSAENYEVKIGAGYLFEELDRAMLGHKKGEKFTADVTFPENYDDEELAGKAATFEIEVQNVFNADYTVSHNTDFESEWELKEALRVLNFAKSILLDRIVEQSEVIEYPKNLLTQYEKHYKDEVASVIASYVQNGYTESQAENALYGAGGSEAYIKTNAENDVKGALVAYSIKKEYGMEYTEKDYQDSLNGLRVYYYYYQNVTYTNAQLEAMYTKDILRNQFVYRKVADLLFEKITFDGAPEIPQKAE